MIEAALLVLCSQSVIISASLAVPPGGMRLVLIMCDQSLRVEG